MVDTEKCRPFLLFRANLLRSQLENKLHFPCIQYVNANVVNSTEERIGEHLAAPYPSTDTGVVVLLVLSSRFPTTGNSKISSRHHAFLFYRPPSKVPAGAKNIFHEKLFLLVMLAVMAMWAEAQTKIILPKCRCVPARLTEALSEGATKAVVDIDVTDVEGKYVLIRKGTPVSVDKVFDGKTHDICQLVCMTVSADGQDIVLMCDISNDGKKGRKASILKDTRLCGKSFYTYMIQVD